ncbi:calmodulin-A-like [Drosophila rhopaloa]|uniref:EF-hand domain-containing protein n=1 Tax=Drosophila rhopaloa TaxID=1041015 RepID=A0ABM5JEU0_DRORH|nr:calmodulin-A-like [Drosophila rhopaloa]
MSDIGEQYKAELNEIYALFGKENPGVITAEDLNTVMQHLGRRPNSEELRDMVLAADSGGSGSVDFQRFCRMVIRAENEEMIRECFQRFDRDGDGVLSVEELHQALEETLEEEPDRATVQEMMQEGDPDGTGTISYASFMQMALKYQKDD